MCVPVCNRTANVITAYVFPGAENEARVCTTCMQKRQMSRKGLVAQALAAAIQGYMEEWGVMVAQLEHLWRQGRLTLQGMLFYW